MIDQPFASLLKLPLVYKLRFVLRGGSPLIWRHLLVPAELTLAGLHVTLQLAFGWTDQHLHQIRIHVREFGSMGRDPATARLSDLRLCYRTILTAFVALPSVVADCSTDGVGGGCDELRG